MKTPYKILTQARIGHVHLKVLVDKSLYDRNKRIKQCNIIVEVDFIKVELAYKSSQINLGTSQKQLLQLKSQLNFEQNKNNFLLQIE